jgi:VanZ family protein
VVAGVSLVVLFSPSTPSEGGLYGIDKVVHATLFLLLALTTRLRFRRGLVWVLLYAPVSEVLQAVLPIHRDGNVPDAVFDCLGAAIGWWVAGWITTRSGEARATGSAMSDRSG